MKYNQGKIIVSNIKKKLHKSIIQLFYKKWTKDMNRSFSKKETFLSSKIMKRRLISLVIREMKTETQWDSYHFTHSIGRNYEFDDTVIGEDMETLSHCCYNINSFQLNPYKYLIFSYQYSIYFTGVGKHRLAVVNMWRGVNKAIVMIINCMSFYMWTTQPTFAHPCMHFCLCLKS